MDLHWYTWVILANDWIIVRPILFQVVLCGGCGALLFVGIKQNEPTYFGWYAGWVVGLESCFGVFGVMWLLDTGSHPDARSYAFYLLYIFSAQWIRMSFFLWIGNLIFFRQKLTGQILGPILAMILLFSSFSFCISAILDYLVFSDYLDHR